MHFPAAPCADRASTPDARRGLLPPRLRAAVLPGLLLAAAACSEAAPAGPTPSAATASKAPDPGAAAPSSLPAGHQWMLAALRDIRARTGKENRFQGDGRMLELKAALAALPKSASPAARFRVLSELGDSMVYYGEERDGLARMQEGYDLLPAARPSLEPEAAETFLFRFASAWLRLAETENCCARHSAVSCILPLQGAAIHARPEGSRRAMEILREVLAGTAPSSTLHLNARWLYSIAAMTLGEYPDKVPEGIRIPPSFFAGDEPFPHFENVAGKVGLDILNLAGGIIADDFDNDGDIDLMISNWSTEGQLHYFRNEGDGTFTNRTKEAGLTGLFGGLNLIQADYDGDGFVDALVLRGAWHGKFGRHPNSLLHNNHDGTFTDRTLEAGLAKASYPTDTAAWTDYDNDGDLDLYIGNETTAELSAPCELYRNNGDGTFTDVAAAAGVTNDRFTRAVMAGDYDGDRLPDLYVSNLDQENRLYRNRGDGTFEDVAPRLGVTGPLVSYPGWFWDYDNDGVVDIMVLAFQSRPGDLARVACGAPGEVELSALYRGDGKGGFKDVGRESNLVKPFSAMGCNVGDFDNDGYLDFYVGTGRPIARDLVPNMAYHNLRGKGFADVTLPSGLGHLQKGHGIAFADLDGDGDLDVFAQMGGAYRADEFHNALFENPGFGNRWLTVRLEGRTSNRSALGARIRAEIVEDGRRRSVYRTVSSGGTFGANPLRQHLGLGRAERIELLEVTWPTTGKTQVFRDLPIDRFVEIVEGSDKPTVKELKPVKLGGGSR